MRKIIHIDMDCYYAAIECRDDPRVASKPVGVGGQSARGVLTTCNYIAREYGCRSAMPVFQALKLCPDLVLKPVRFDVYREESRKIREIFARHTDLIEPLSLDEAYLDVSHRNEYAWDIAKQIRSEIFETTRLTASAGIAPNKMLAKIASDWNKPNGQFAVLPDQIESFMRDLPLRKLWGIGPKTTQRLHTLGYETCGQIQPLEITDLHQIFGHKWSHEIYNLCRGIDERPVQTSRERKSMSVERTYPEDLPTIQACEAELPDLLDELRRDLAKRPDKTPYTKIVLKLKFSDFQRTTKERIANDLTVAAFSPLLAEAFERNPNAVRLMGVGVRFPSDRSKNHIQLELPFSEFGKKNRKE